MLKAPILEVPSVFIESLINRLLVKLRDFTYRNLSKDRLRWKQYVLLSSSLLYHSEVIMFFDSSYYSPTTNIVVLVKLSLKVLLKEPKTITATILRS